MEKEKKRQIMVYLNESTINELDKLIEDMSEGKAFKISRSTLIEYLIKNEINKQSARR